jgi:2-keto-4-pentenoate hydratase/2-oxohepta-3-ene-1,7-dioic acid hydratase in catechol pathway
MPLGEGRDGTAAWSLVTYVDVSSAARVGALVDEWSVVPIPWLPDVTDVGAVVERWTELGDLLVAWEPDHNHAVTDVRLQVPIRAPGKLLFAGANFDDHIREMGIAAIPAGLRPYFFLLPRTALAAPGEAVEVPEDPSARIDWEAELAVVIGVAGRHIGVDTALEHVAGYTIVNDVTARGLHRREVELAPPFAYDWLGSKGRDGFCPIGPGIVPARFVPDPQDLSIRLWVNEELRQDGHTSDMIFTVAELISAASEIMTLEPGDVISTGTPAGVGAQRGQHLRPGDVVVAEIPPLGRLENPVIAERTPRPLASAATPNPT